MKRKVGRPKDTGANDEPYLRLIVAEMMAGIPQAEAMRRTRPKYRGTVSCDDSLFARWRKKLRVHRDRLIAEARATEIAEVRRRNDEQALLAARYGGAFPLAIKHLSQVGQFALPSHLQRMLQTVNHQQNLLDLIYPSYLREMERMVRERQRVLESIDPLSSVRWAMGGRYF